jgi:hypothetical protein
MAHARPTAASLAYALALALPLVAAQAALASVFPGGVGFGPLGCALYLLSIFAPAIAGRWAAEDNGSDVRKWAFWGAWVLLCFLPRPLLALSFPEPPLRTYFSAFLEFAGTTTVYWSVLPLLEGQWRFTLLEEETSGLRGQRLALALREQPELSSELGQAIRTARLRGLLLPGLCFLCVVIMCLIKRPSALSASLTLASVAACFYSLYCQGRESRRLELGNLGLWEDSTPGHRSRLVWLAALGVALSAAASFLLPSMPVSWLTALGKFLNGIFGLKQNSRRPPVSMELSQTDMGLPGELKNLGPSLDPAVVAIAGSVIWGLIAVAALALLYILFRPYFERGGALSLLRSAAASLRAFLGSILSAASSFLSSLSLAPRGASVRPGLRKKSPKAKSVWQTILGGIPNGRPLPPELQGMAKAFAAFVAAAESANCPWRPNSTPVEFAQRWALLQSAAAGADSAASGKGLGNGKEVSYINDLVRAARLLEDCAYGRHAPAAAAEREYFSALKAALKAAQARTRAKASLSISENSFIVE